MYVMMGIGRKAVGDTPEEAAQAWVSMGGRGRTQLIRTPAYVTRENLDAELRSFHKLVPAGTGDDDSWVLVPQDNPLGTSADLFATPRPPRTLPGYAAGLAAGQFRLPPQDPPTPLPGVPGNVVVIAGFVVPMAAAALFLFPATRNFVGMIAFLVVFASSLIIGPAWSKRRLYDELDAGYVTLPATKVWRSEESRLAWGYRGTWVLSASGRVKAEPERWLDAPGFYPSPTEPGLLQLWTGVEWFPEFREPPTAVADPGSGIVRW